MRREWLYKNAKFNTQELRVNRFRSPIVKHIQLFIVLCWWLNRHTNVPIICCEIIKANSEYYDLATATKTKIKYRKSTATSSICRSTWTLGRSKPFTAYHDWLRFIPDHISSQQQPRPLLLVAAEFITNLPSPIIVCFVLRHYHFAQLSTP